MRAIRSAFTRLTLAVWLAVAALCAGGFEQQQLGDSVIQATFAEAHAAALGLSGHFMPDGTFMAGPMGPAHDAGGHTHKGHVDCEVCGALAAMAALTLPSLTIVTPPTGFILPATAEILRAPARALSPSPYSSRGPPVLS